MIAPRNTASTPITAAVTSSSIPIPAGTVAGDLLIAWCEIGQLVTNFSTPTGWTQFSWSPVVDAGNSNAFAFWKIAVNSEPSPSVSWTTSSKGVITCLAYSSVDNANPIGNSNVNVETASQTTATTPSLAATANQWAVTIHSSRTSTVGNKAPTWAPAPSGETQRNSTDNSAAGAAPWNSVVAYDSNGVVTVASHSYTATSNFTESHHKSALIYLNNVAPQIAETAAAADTVTSNVALPRAIADSAAATDTVTRALSTPRPIADSAPATDTVTRTLAQARAIGESAAAVDSVTAFVHGPMRDLIVRIGEPFNRWQIGPAADPQVTFGEPVNKWQVEALMLTRSVLSTEYVRTKVEAVAAGLSVDPTGDQVQMAFMAGTTNPGSGDWLTASWEVTAVTGVYFARCLVGPAGGVVALAVGVYTIWVKMLDAPETIIRPFGNIKIQ